MPDIWGSLAPSSPEEQAAVEAAAQAAALRQRRGIAARPNPPLLQALSEIPQRMYGAGAGFANAASQAANEQFPMQSAPFALGKPMDVSTDYDPRREAASLGAETAMNVIGAPGVMGGVPADALGSAAKGIRAYHGSPHDFDRFDLNKIGTGEGAQSYGHGLYFAENPKVATDYKNKLAAGKGWAAGWLQDAKGDPELAKQLYIKSLRGSSFGPKPETLDAIDRAAKIPHGRMYEVNINAHPDEFLNWDKPLRDQPIVDQIRSIVPRDVLYPFDKNIESGISGANAYHNYIPSQRFAVRPDISSPWEASNAATYEDALKSVGGDKSRLQTVLTPSKENASAMLNKAGVPGIKYLDQGSRHPGFSSLTPQQLDARIEVLQKDIASGGGDQARMKDKLTNLQRERDTYRNQTSNYVVFNDKLIDILRKYMVPGAIGAGGFGSLAPKQDNQP
jgi:hypothetical protein